MLDFIIRWPQNTKNVLLFQISWVRRYMIFLNSGSNIQSRRVFFRTFYKCFKESVIIYNEKGISFFIVQVYYISIIYMAKLYFSLPPAIIFPVNWYRIKKKILNQKNTPSTRENIIYTRNCLVVCCSLYVQAIDMLDASVSSTLEFCGTRNTYFVPTDYAFRKLGALELERMFNDPSYMRKVLSNHRAERILPSALIKERWQYDVQTKNEVVRITNKGNRLMVRWYLTIHAREIEVL